MPLDRHVVTDMGSWGIHSAWLILYSHKIYGPSQFAYANMISCWEIKFCEKILIILLAGQKYKLHRPHVRWISQKAKALIKINSIFKSIIILYNIYLESHLPCSTVDHNSAVSEHAQNYTGIVRRLVKWWQQIRRFLIFFLCKVC